MKQVSVLFCDLVGSTALTERIGAEAMRDLVGRFLDISTGEVRRFGGTVPQFRGDGFMAVFGAPRTYEDHVRRALLAALAVRRALGGEAGMGEPGELDLPVRMGIHSGPVVFGLVGGGFATETIIGDTPNVAQRLQEMAEPGAILISENTRQAALGYVRANPIGPLAIRGKSEPVTAYRLLGVSRSRATRDGLAPTRTTSFVDRVDEVAALLNFVEQAENGHGLVVGSVGEPGIGKSRMLDELRRRLGYGRVTWAEGRCLSYGTAIPYLLMLDLFRSNCGIVESDTREAIIHKVRSSLRSAGMDQDEAGPILLHLLGIKTADDAALAPPPETIKEKVFEIFRELAVRGSCRRPLILVLEDLHWVDSISEAFIEYLAEVVAKSRILILATYRPDYRPPWANRSYSRQITLQPLSRDDSLHVVHSVMRDAALAPPVTEEIVAKADGNPLFLEQLALHAGEAKGRRSELMVPATIHDVVMARIDRLPDEIKRLLQTGAVIGREFSLRLVTTVWDGPGAVDAGLRELCHFEFLDEWPDDEGTTYVFRHALTQEAAYGSLLERDRRNRHGEVGRALEALYAGRSEEVAELLALHFGRSGEAEKAVDYAIIAAEKSQRRWANQQALSYFDNALQRLEAMPDTAANRLRRVDAVLKQAEVKFALGQHTEHIQALEGIRGLIDHINEPQRRAAWHYWAAFLHSLTGSPPALAIEHCRQAAAIAVQAGSDELPGYIASCAAQAYVVAGELRAAIESGERALAIFEAQGNLWWASRTLWHVAQAAIYLGEWKASHAYCRRALAHGNTLNDLRLKAVGLYRTGSAYIQQGDLERGLRCCEEALALKPIPYDVAMAKVFRGYGRIKAGQLDAGITDLNEAIAWFDSSNLRHVRLAPALRLAEGYLFDGQIAIARGLVDDVLAKSRLTGYRYLEGLANRLMAECLAARSPDIAMRHVAEAQRIFEATDAQNDLAKSLVTRATLLQASGEFRAARALLEEAGAIFEALGTLDEPVRVSAALAALERVHPIDPSRGTP